MDRESLLGFWCQPNLPFMCVDVKVVGWWCLSQPLGVLFLEPLRKSTGAGQDQLLFMPSLG